MSRGWMWMVAAAVIFAWSLGRAAQTAPAGSGWAISATATCATPALGIFGFCKPAGGGKAQWTDDGSSYATVNLAGVAGPAGPQGPAGPAGPPGPAGAAPSSYTCSSMTVTSTGVTLSGCK